MFVDQKYFNDNGENIVFVGPYMEAYIPRYYFDKRIADSIGEHFTVLGVFSFITFNKVEGTHPNHIRTMNLPIMISTFPTTTAIKRIDLLGDGNEEEYVVFKYYKGDILCRNKTPQSKDIFKVFLDLLMAGKLPKTIAYPDVLNIWMKNFSMNGVSFDIPSTVYEIVISKIYRNKNKPEESFSKVIGKNPKTSPYDYSTASARDITAYSSRFAGIMFEDMDAQLTSAISSTRSNKKESVSPMEELLKY